MGTEDLERTEERIAASLSVQPDWLSNWGGGGISLRERNAGRAGGVGGG